MNIRGKLILAFFTVTLISVATLSVIAIDNSTRTIKREIEDALNSLVDEKVNLMYSYLEDKEHGVVILAELPIVTSALENLPTVFEQGVDNPAYLAEEKRILPALNQFKARFDIYDLFLIAPNGDIMFTITHESDSGTNLKTGPYRETQLARVFERAVTLLESSISRFEPYAPSQWQLHELGKGKGLGPVQGKEAHSAFIAAPVFKGNRLLGALAIQINSDDYDHLATNYTGLKRTGEVVIGKLENNHAVIIASLRHNPQAAFNLRIPIGSEMARPIQRALKGEKGSGLSIDYNGTEILAAWRYVPEMGWGIVIKIDTAEAFAAAEQLKQRFLFIGIGVMLLAAVVALFFANRLSAPLVVLTSATKGIINGNYDQQIEIQTSDEIGRLGHSFNRMAAQLRQAMDERAQAEMKLENSNKQNQKALDNLAEQKFALDQHAIVFITDIKGTITFVNDKFSEISGYNRDELIGQKHHILNSGHHKPEFFRDMYQIIVEGEVWKGEICNRAEDGHLYWLDTTIVPFTGAEGNPQSYITICTDVTERKQAETLLKDSEERNRLLLDSTAEAIFGLDLNGNCTFCNPACLKMLGYDKQDNLLGKNMHELIHHSRVDGSPYPVEDCHIYKAFIENESSHLDTEVLFRKDGGSFPVEYWSYPIIRDGNIIGSVVTFLDITERKHAQAQLTYQASHDALTGLINRDEFERRIKRLLSTLRQDKGEHALCFMDLDQFKIVNDTCGHVAGDEMLRQLSLILQAEVRKRDTLARLGGDEFAVLMEHCSLDHAYRVASSLLEAIQSYQFSWARHSFKVGVSIGLVAITEVIPNITELLKHADAACYMAKELGRNRIHVYYEEDQSLAGRHGEMQWVTRIHQALEDGRFCLYAQAIVPLDSSNDKHYELLLRMKDENGELIPPGAFLPAAERYYLMEKLDSWIIENSFNLLAENPAFLKQIEFISINLSGQSLTKHELLDFIISNLDKTGIDRNKICFEITETAAIANLSTATKFISSLKGLGCRFALDDFGSGLSSFAYLKNLPVDYLKIDGMFVKDIVNDPIDRAMVKSINEIGQVMGMQTIAEFVENEEIKGILTEIGVNYAQGHGIGKTLPFNELLVRANNVTDLKNTESNQVSRKLSE